MAATRFVSPNHRLHTQKRDRSFILGLAGSGKTGCFGSEPHESEELSTGDRLLARQVVKFAFQPLAARCGVNSMSERGSGATEAVVPFAPKSVARSDPNDPLEKAGHLILDMVRQAAGNAQASYQHAVETSRKLAAQLQGAEDRMKELESKIRYQQDRADRAEKWLYQISQEIEQKLLGGNDRRPLEPPRPQAAFRDQRQ